MFAKLFDTEVGQILVKKDEGDNGLEIRFYFQPNNLGVCSVALTGFSDDESGYSKIDKAFEDIDEAAALKIIKPTIDRLTGVFN